MKIVNLIGQTFGRLTVVEKGGKDSKHNRLWICKCECGNIIAIRGMSLRSGCTISCGCIAQSVSRQNIKAAQDACRTHGGSGTPTYNSWIAMMNRCYKSHNAKYSAYGAKGISVCTRWHCYEHFLADMGNRPAGHTLDRFPNRNGNYTPSNCRWATPKEQQRNRDSGLHVLTFNGKTQCITDWALETGIPREIIYIRINRNNWPVDLALTHPPKTRLCSVIQK